MVKSILLSGMKPTGIAHIGNYFGALKQWVDLQEAGEHECYFMLADYHALNFIQDAGQMHALTRELAQTLLAIGLDPERVVIFKQSDVPAHTELTWVFDTITTMPYLMRAHAFKDAEAKDKEINVGTFNYPMLMAADILLYDTQLVPVGQDQKQHIEYARDTAEKFNRLFGETFTLPKEYIMPEVAVVPGTDGQKMSKSYGNTIPLFASREEITKAVMGIVTDSSGGRPENVYAIHKLIIDEHVLAPIYESNSGNYKALKEALIEDLDAFIAPMRERYESLAKNDAEVDEVLHRGGEIARAKASSKIEKVRRLLELRNLANTLRCSIVQAAQRESAMIEKKGYDSQAMWPHTAPGQTVPVNQGERSLRVASFDDQRGVPIRINGAAPSKARLFKP